MPLWPSRTPHQLSPLVPLCRIGEQTGNQCDIPHRISMGCHTNSLSVGMMSIENRDILPLSCSPFPHLQAVLVPVSLSLFNTALHFSQDLTLVGWGKHFSLSFFLPSISSIPDWVPEEVS